MGLPRKNTVNTRPVNSSLLHQFVPISSLEPDSLLELAKHARLISIPAGGQLFKRNDSDNLLFFLLQGTIELHNRETRLSISAQTEQARLVLDQHTPRQFTAVAQEDSEVIVIDRNLLDILLTWDPYSGYLVNDIEDTRQCDPDDWMELVLQSHIFRHVPPINIQLMFHKLQSQPVRKGETIFDQGEPGEYFYLIQAGRCAVLRNSGAGQATIATLAAGQAFGEEALLSDAPRNASIRMLSDGILLRLAKTDFDELLKTPVVRSLSRAQIEAQATRFVWLDVRMPEEHVNDAIPASRNLPLHRLRDALAELNRDDIYLVYCDAGQRSTCAAYLLNSFGYQAYVLAGGLQRYKAEQ